MCLLDYAGFLQFDELVNIRRSIILIQELKIKLSFQKLKLGSWVVITITNKETFPVKYLQMYLSVFNIHENSDEFIFRKASYIYVKKIIHIKKMGVFLKNWGKIEV